jgi:hypothetical protein
LENAFAESNATNMTKDLAAKPHQHGDTSKDRAGQISQREQTALVHFSGISP